MFGVILVFLRPLPSSMSISFTVDSMIRGNHVYKDIWDSHLGEELTCRRERNNIHDPYAVAVLKSDVIVGHIPRAISAACYVFLGRAGSTISCKVTGPRRYSADLPQGGLEIPCSIEFKGENSMVGKMQSLLGCQKSTTRSESTNYLNEDSPVHSVSIKSEKTEEKIVSNIATDKEPIAKQTVELAVSGSSIKIEKAEVTTKLEFKSSLDTTGGTKRQKIDINCSHNNINLWVKCGKISLSKLQRQEIERGDWLDDYHINFAQNLIKIQFNIEGLQSTLLQKSCKPTVNQLQIIHTRGNHWIVASTILSSPAVVTVYDTLYDTVDGDTADVILNLFGGNLKIYVATIQKQRGLNDCGVFSIANAVELAKKSDPAKINYIQWKMRSHLIKCFSQSKLTSFPSQNSK